MARHIKEFYTCDLCKQQIPENHLMKDVPLPVVHVCNDTDGHPESPYISKDTHDFCFDCLNKVTVLQVGFRNSDLQIKNENIKVTL